MIKFLKQISPLQRSTALIIFTIALVKIPIVIRDLVLTTYFGVSKSLDNYLYSMIVPMFFAGIISLSLNFFFIPAYLKIKTQSGTDHAKEYAHTFFIYLSAVLIMVALAIGVIIPGFIVKMNPVFFNSATHIEYFYHLSKWASIFFLFYTLSSFFTSLLQAEHRYQMSLYPQILIPLSGIISVVLNYQSLGIASAIYGATLGSVFCFLIYYFYSLKAKLINGIKGGIGSLKSHGDHSQFFILIFALIIPSFIGLIDQQMASLLGEGKLTTLAYGMRIPDGFSEIISSGLAIAVFSHFSQWHIENRHDLIIEASQKLILLATFFLIPLCAFMMLYAGPIISVIFKRGAFDQTATLAVSQVLQSYVFVFYLTVIATIAIRIISSLGKFQFFIFLGLIIFVLKITLNLLLMQKFNIVGIALAAIIMQVFNCYLLYGYLQKNGLPIFNQNFINLLFKAFVIVTVAIFVFSFIKILANDLIDMSQILIGILALSSFWGMLLVLNKKYQMITLPIDKK